MTIWTFISANPSGYIMVKGDGSMFLKESLNFRSPGVGGEEWDITEILSLKPEGKILHQLSKWEIRREKEEIFFEMIDKESTVNWGVPLKVSIARKELQDVYCLFNINRL